VVLANPALYADEVEDLDGSPYEYIIATALIHEGKFGAVT